MGVLEGNLVVLWLVILVVLCRRQFLGVLDLNENVTATLCVVILDENASLEALLISMFGCLQLIDMKYQSPTPTPNPSPPTKKNKKS